MGMPLSRRQKSWDILDHSAMYYARQHKTQPQQVIITVTERTIKNQKQNFPLKTNLYD